MASSCCAGSPVIESDQDSRPVTAEKMKSAVAFIGAFEEAVATEAHRRNVDGVICGHIHHAAVRTFSGVHYLNCGDWVESCTALIETRAGELRVVHWRPEGGIEPLLVPAASAAA